MTNRATELTTTRNRLNRVHERLEYERQRIAELHQRMAQLEAEKVKYSKVVGLIDRAIAKISKNGVERIETTVSNGLRLAFNDPRLGLKVLTKEGTRGRSYEIVGVCGDVQGPFLDTFGGGIANVAAFLLRLIMLKRFNLAKFLVLDESFNNVAAVFQPTTSELLRTLARDGGYTIFAVTHQPILALAADRVYSAEPQGDAPPQLVEVTSREQLDMILAVQNYLEAEKNTYAAQPTKRAVKAELSASVAETVA